MVEENNLSILTSSQENFIFNEFTFSPNTLTNLLPDCTHPNGSSHGNIDCIENSILPTQFHNSHNICLINSTDGVPLDDNQLNENLYGNQHQLPALMHKPLVPPLPTSSIISNEEYPGPLNLEVFIDPHIMQGNTWVYSDKLKKVFIGMGNSFPVDFRVKPDNKVLFIRATPLFSLAQYAQDPVLRCIAHAQKYDGSNQGVPEHVWHHVIRCHSSGAVYQGDHKEGERLSVVVPLEKPQIGNDTVRIMFCFVCKNSCPSGMNRKALEVVYTLEDINGDVLGRTKVNIRVCSSPKRDREKEERDFMRRSGNEDIPSSKRLKENPRKPLEKKDENHDLKKHEITIPIIGYHNVNQVLKYAFDVMAGDQKRHNVVEPFQDCMNIINTMLGKSE